MAEFKPRPSGPSRSSDRGSDSRGRGDRDDRGPRAGGDKRRRFQIRKKVCRFCVDKTPFIDYKDVKTLRFFITERGKILPRRISGNCARHQREVTVAVQRCRNIALIPFAGEK
jgi:small subunit ribosomal protein S18